MSLIFTQNQKSLVALLLVFITISSGIFAAPVDKRNFLNSGAKPLVTFQNANENIATTEAANVNSLGMESLNAAEAASNFDHENLASLVVVKRDEGKRNFLNNGGYAPLVTFQNANENIASTEAANVNSFGMERLGASEAATNFDHENLASLVIVKRDEGKRNFLNNGYAPLVTFQNANENIATTEAANVNSFGLERLGAAEAASTFDNENANMLFIAKRDESKRAFLNNGYAPLVTFQHANENIASTEAAKVNSLGMESLNAAESATNFDNENAQSFLIVKRDENKRAFLNNGFQPLVSYQNANQNIATTEAANVNSLGIEAFNAAEAASAFDFENAQSLLVVKN